MALKYFVVYSKMVMPNNPNSIHTYDYWPSLFFINEFPSISIKSKELWKLQGDILGSCEGC